MGFWLFIFFFFFFLPDSALNVLWKL